MTRHQIQFVDRLHLASGDHITVRIGYTLELSAPTKGSETTRVGYELQLTTSPSAGVPTRVASVQFGDGDRVNMLATEMQLLADALLIGGYSPFLRWNNQTKRLELFAGAKCNQPVADVTITQAEIRALQGGMRYLLNLENPNIKCEEPC
jgi:hypothetical protein